MNPNSNPERGAVGVADPTPPDEPGLERATLMSAEITAPGIVREAAGTGGTSSHRSRPARPMREDSASQPNMEPIFRTRMRIVSAIALACSILVLVLIEVLHRGRTDINVNHIRLTHATAFVFNLAFFALYSWKKATINLLGPAHILFFFGNMVLFVTLPHLEIGLNADLYNAASLIVLLRSVFIPCCWQFSLGFGLVLWSIYPMTVLIGAQYSPFLAEQLADPGLRGQFIMGNVDIGMSLAIGIVAVAVYHNLRMQAYAAEQAGSYRLLEKLGEGGMGEVYRARHALLHRPTAVKMLRKDLLDSATAMKRFEREVRAVSELTHPNTISIYDFGKTEAGHFYYAMEFLDGMDLQAMVDKHGALPPARVVYVLEQILGSLGEAHWRGILHRDVKPSNIYLTVRGRTLDFAKVLDFGLVKEMSADPQFTAGLTADASITGTPLYMAPERFYGDQTADHRSDLYAVGAIGYFLLAGRPVFDSKNPMQALIDHVRTPPVPPRNLVPGMSAELDAVILKALEKEPAQRFDSADDFIAALQRTPEFGRWSQDQAMEWWSQHSTGPAIACQPITPSA